MSEVLKYIDIGLIKSDLKRLKKWKTLEGDIRNNVKIMKGRIEENGFISPTLLEDRTIFGDFITKKEFNDEEIIFFKKRIGITSPIFIPRNGARLIFGITKKLNKFFPILIFGAYEEKKFYKINGKNISLQKIGIIKIIEEKLRGL